MSTAIAEAVGYAQYTFAILFTTLGPLKTIPVFYALTQDRPFRHQADLAFRAFVDAAVLVAVVFFAAEGTMRRWGVSVAAITIAGGLILFVTALRTITGFSLAELPATKPELADAKASTKASWLGRPVLSPLTVPTIVTPAGVVAILFFLGAGETPAYRLSLFLQLSLMMLLNLGGMLLARPIMRAVGLPLLQITGWVFSVLQAGLAVQAVINALRALRALP
jgi:small neutral amino acid transporter SnatA (MarC family)